MQKPIYLDYNSTSPADPRVIEAMLPYLREDFGNPSNTLHSYGWSAENAVKKAADQVAELLGCKSSELVWNAGATEGNNSVIFGLIRKIKSENPTEPIHMITSNAEHWSVLNSLAAAEKFEKISVSLIPVDATGAVTVDELKKQIRPHTKLVSVIWVNNEIGSINPINALSEYCHQNKIYFHTDATQAVGKIQIDLKKNHVHFLTFSAHKLYGPKGVGVLFTRSSDPSVEIEAFVVGGGQQNNRRSGTLNVPAIVGTGQAAEICRLEMVTDSEKTKQMISQLYSEIKKELPTVKLNGPELNQRSPVNLSLQMPTAIDLVLPRLTKLAFSQGSACQSGELTSSHVLKAIGLNPSEAARTIRLSIGRFTTQTDITEAVKIILTAFKTPV